MAAGEFVTLAGGRHELFMERPDIQAELWTRIDAFLAATEGASPPRVAN